jgi:hypothetical protein
MEESLIGDKKVNKARARTGKKAQHVLGIIVDGARKLLGTVSLVENIMRQRLEISQVRAGSQPL